MSLTYALERPRRGIVCSYGPQHEEKILCDRSKLAGATTTSVLACAAACCCFSCCGQSNTCLQAARFYLPPVQLRQEPKPESAVLQTKVDPQPTAVKLDQNLTLNSGLDDENFQSSVVRKGEFYLTRAELPSDSAVVRFVDNIFTPEVIHIGKKEVTCSVLTAIKRKNPLCLLNPLFFQLSW